MVQQLERESVTLQSCASARTHRDCNTLSVAYFFQLTSHKNFLRCRQFALQSTVATLRHEFEVLPLLLQHSAFVELIPLRKVAFSIWCAPHFPHLCFFRALTICKIVTSSSFLQKERKKKFCLKMAVPFSRPCYTGTSNNSGSGSSNRRRPRGRPSQQPQPQPQNNQQNQQDSHHQQQQQNQDHPVTRFLYGDGQVHLDSLSLTSRIAFYALYEAWRLLQDLTQNQNGSSSVNNNRRRRPRPQQTHVPVTPVRPSSQDFVRPDVIPRGEDVSTQSTYSMVTSDVESACSSPFQSPVKSQSHEQVKRQRLMSSSEDDEDDCRTHERFTANISSRNFNNYPDMIPDDYDSCKPINNNNRWSSNYPDLISTNHHHHHQDDSEEEEEEKGYDDVDGGDDSRLLNNVGGVDWSKLGSQLCSIASSFESTFYKPVTEEQKAIYEAFQRIKMSSSQFLDRDNSLSGLAKTICRQVLLSSIWILLKKVL